MRMSTFELSTYENTLAHAYMLSKCTHALVFARAQTQTHTRTDRLGGCG